MRWLSNNTADGADRFVVLAPRRAGLPEDLEAIIRLGYTLTASAMPGSAANAWILFEKH